MFLNSNPASRQRLLVPARLCAGFFLEKFMDTLTLVTMATDLMSSASALMPLIQSLTATGKKEVDDADVRAALAGKDAALARLDLLIAQRVAAERAAPVVAARPAP
jgi:hypothetical protein